MPKLSNTLVEAGFSSANSRTVLSIATVITLSLQFGRSFKVGDGWCLMCPVQNSSRYLPQFQQSPIAGWKREIPNRTPAALSKCYVPYRAGYRSRLACGPGSTMVSLGKFPQKVQPHRSSGSHSRAFQVDILRLHRVLYPQARHFAKPARFWLSSSLEFRLTGRGPGRERLHRSVGPDGKGLAMRIGK